MKRVTHALLVLLFTLLQCVSPLVHAHVDGRHSHSTHTHLVNLTNELNTPAPKIFIEEPASVSIGISDEFQRDVNISIQKTTSISPTPKSAVYIYLHPIVTPSSFQNLSYFQLPQQQAPPHKSN